MPECRQLRSRDRKGEREREGERERQIETDRERERQREREREGREVSQRGWRPASKAGRRGKRF